MNSLLQPKLIKLRQLIAYALLLVLLVFIASAIVTKFEEKFRLTTGVLDELTSNMKGETLLLLFGYENPYFNQVLPSTVKKPSPSTLLFKLTTNIDPNDPRSLLGNELPGFSIFDSTIAVAGEGTNFANLPVESSPPDDILKSQGEVDVNNADTPNNNNSSSGGTPSKTTNGKKVVFFYNTHSLESYLPALNGVTDPNKAWSSKVNVGTVANQIGIDLQNRGIGYGMSNENVTKELQDKGMKYGQSYTMSRHILKEVIDSNEDYKLFFDIHRDASPKKRTTVTINNKTYARVAFVIGQGNRNYKKNIEMAKELHHFLENSYPGLSRGVIVKDKSEGDGVYNQDLSDHAVLIEIGGYDNNMDELDRTADALADVISKYYWDMSKTGK